MNRLLKVLLLEDNPHDAELILRELKKAGISHTHQRVLSRDEFIRSLQDFVPDIILADHSLPGFDSISALQIAQKQTPLTPFILVTGSVSEEFAVTSIKSGADDYLLKSNLIRLPAAIRTALDKRGLEKENDSIRRLNDQLKEANLVIKQRNKDITDSISYAQRIQQAMFPEKDYLKKLFPESLLLFKPKDILSGDFYWLAESDGKILVAAGDCTGHGVPGALMSMIGFHLLNEIVNVKDIAQPAEILNRLHKGIRNALKQDESNSSTRDGIDIAICTFHKKKNRMEFASARRPLYLIREETLSELEYDKKSAGGVETGSAPFYNRTLTVEPGDRIYMFSDGYADQFGGEKNKRMMSRRFRELLLETCTLDMARQQKKMEVFYEEWRGDNEQTDDILVLGLKL